MAPKISPSLPLPPPIPTRGMRKGPDSGQSSKKECFHPKRGLTWGVCLAGVALNRRILRGKKKKKRQKKTKKKGVGSKGSSHRAKAPKPQEIAPKPRQRGRPTRKGRERPATKPPKKRVGKGENRYLCCFSPKLEIWTELGRWLQNGSVSPRVGRPHFCPNFARFPPVSKRKRNKLAGSGPKMAGSGPKMAGSGPKMSSLHGGAQLHALQRALQWKKLLSGDSSAEHWGGRWVCNRFPSFSPQNCSGGAGFCEGGGMGLCCVVLFFFFFSPPSPLSVEAAPQRHKTASNWPKERSIAKND